ncbi:MAG: allophanate hydrolase [Methylocystis sp.]|nr:allophanate hydrolase [Methylocystis sp.]MCA3583854.1 allophanate hydrolase [Methylocystis sp.]MCA3588644.1 allophanate hydrolase [Methylocystis sp.]MCA3592955.1 allophanate hydrolase [Methylocystis sp.]
MTLPLPAAFDLASVESYFGAGGAAARLIEEVYRRIRELADPGIFITLADEDAALAAAETLDRIDASARGPLFGVPFAVKDNIDVAGLPTTAACPGFAYMPAATAPAVQRLLDAGAILIGKTNLDQFATGLVGVRTPYPIPRNAIDAALVPGGSSSGSAVAVAQGLVTFALGTDTAGSGRVPAALNNIVGLKPSPGSISTTGVLPACRTLDCVSVFALTVDDAATVHAAMAGYDPADPYSRTIPLSPPGPAPKAMTIGIPRREDLRFFGDDLQSEAWQRALGLLEARGARLAPIAMAPFFETAALLYEGPWVAERHAAIADVLERKPDIVHPVTRRIVEGANGFSATALFKAQYRLAALRRQTSSIWKSITMLAVPTTPVSPTLEALAADPMTPNSRCGAYTNFVNLLDQAALAVPGPFRSDGRAAGITFIGPSGSDGMLASVGRVFHRAVGITLGATGAGLPAEDRQHRPSGQDGLIEIAVIGAHLSGMPLNHELTGNGGVFRRAVTTTADYRFHALAGGPPRRPGLLRIGDGAGLPVQAEVWALPPKGFGRFVAGIPAPLGIGTVRLADGTAPKGFLVEPEGLRGAEDISRFGGWRAYIASMS